MRLDRFTVSATVSTDKLPITTGEFSRCIYRGLQPRSVRPRSRANHMPLHSSSRLIVVLLLGLLATPAVGQQAKRPRLRGTTATAGVLGQDDPQGTGFLLPNGWRLTPAGEQVPLTDLPLNITTSPDGRYAFVATSGYRDHELTVVNLETREKVASEKVPQSWFGLSYDAAEGRLWWSGGGSGLVHAYTWLNGALKPGTPLEPKFELAAAAAADVKPPVRFSTGSCFDAKTRSLYCLTMFSRGGDASFAWGDASKEKSAGGAISKFSLALPDERASAPCGQRPYDVVLARNGMLYVSDWADRRVLVVDPTTLRTVARVTVGDHPNQLALHPTDGRLFVACASSNGVWVIDTAAGVVHETIYTELFPRSPEGCTPDALCLSPDGETLFVANADNNCIAVIDIKAPRRSQVKGYIPTGWYPTSVAVTPDGGRLLVGVGKGNQTLPNKPDQKVIDEARAKPAQEGGYHAIPFPYIGTTLSGALSIVEIPDDSGLSAYTDQVYRNCPFSDEIVSQVQSERKTAIPARVGDPSPIEHVIYIIKENRTYDQVFSDIPRGRRDPSLLMFGEEITPNHHKLANEFVLLDNLYCVGHVSADG
ncbi:MAG: YncE family protein, partial [Planctomycetaceae bacterium]